MALFFFFFFFIASHSHALHSARINHLLTSPLTRTKPSAPRSVYKRGVNVVQKHSINLFIFT